MPPQQEVATHLNYDFDEVMHRPVARTSQLGGKNHKEGETFFKYNIGCMQQPGTKHNGGRHLHWSE